jgi:putative methyltransferase
VREGHPRFVHYSPAKNNPDRSVAIARKLAVSGISPVHTFAVQHTDEQVLASADRSNISVGKQRAVAKAMLADGIPTVAQLILGLPGDSYDRWKGCLTDLMDWGLHDNYQVFNYALLPNAPAADLAFQARWEIGTISRGIPREGTGQRHDGTDVMTRVRIVVKSRSFSPADWVRMKAYTALVRALHNFGLTRLVAQYLHFGHAVTYRRFYDELIEGYFAATPLFRKIVLHFEAFLEDEAALEDLPFERFQEVSYLEAGRWAFIHICLDARRTFDEVGRFLRARFPTATSLASALEYQRRVLLLPDREHEGATFRTDRDWVSYFDRARRLTAHEPLGEPRAVAGGLVEIDDPWAGARPGDERARWVAWMERTQEVRRTLDSTFERLTLRDGCYDPA